MDGKAASIVREAERRWDSLTIKDDFVFCKTMQNEELCREVIEAILHIRIDHIDYIETQESIDLTPQSKGIRLDVYVSDTEGTTFNVEMQAVNTHELPQRSRYYQSLMTLHQLERGRDYRSLKNTYVIFVCDFDLFGQGQRVYSFQARCDENRDLALGDGAHTVFLSATSPADPHVGDRLNEFLDYVAKDKVSGDFSSRLDKAVSRVLSNEEWRLEYMMLAVRDQLNVERGFEQGRAEGLAQGIEKGRSEGLAQGIEKGRSEGLAQGIEKGRSEGLAKGIKEGREAGEERLANLMGALLTSGRTDEATRCIADPALREKLYEELHIE